VTSPPTSNVILRHATSSITVLGAKLLLKYNQVYFKYFEYVLFQNYPSSTMHLNLKVSSDRNNAYEVLFYAFLSELHDMQMETPGRQIIFNHP
jgi:hypothetical protein